jgi:uncharacterized membrane protein
MASDVGLSSRRTVSWLFLPPAPLVALAVAVALWVITFVRLGALRHNQFGTFGFDLGIYDQATWLLSGFRDPFMTVRGLDVFGHHASPGLWVFAPVYWLGGGPKALLVLQVLAQASGAFALYLLARDLHVSRWLGAGLGVVLLLHPTSQYLVWEFFHPETFAIGPLLFAYWAARTARWQWFWPAALLAVSMKEDIALVLAVLGVVVAVRGARQLGLAIAVSALAWFVLATRVLIPWRNGVGPFYEQLFGELGDSPMEVAWNVVRHPGQAMSIATEPDRLEYYRMMFFPVALLPLLAPEALVIGLPMLAVNVFTGAGFPFPRDYRFHYSALVLAAVMVATVEAVAKVRQEHVRQVLVGLLLVTSFASTVAWGASPISRDYDTGIWPLYEDPRVDTRRKRSRGCRAARRRVPRTTSSRTSRTAPGSTSSRCRGNRSTGVCRARTSTTRRASNGCSSTAPCSTPRAPSSSTRCSPVSSRCASSATTSCSRSASPRPDRERQLMVAPPSTAIVWPVT